VAIGELETLAVLLASNMWSNHLHGKRCLFFVDNEGARFSLIKGYSRSQVISCMCSLHTALLDDLFALPWYSRVPSISNIVDSSPRGIPHSLLLECKRFDSAQLHLLLEQFVEKVLDFHFVHQ